MILWVRNRHGLAESPQSPSKVYNQSLSQNWGHIWGLTGDVSAFNTCTWLLAGLFLQGCWPETVLSYLPHRPLQHGSWLVQSTEQAERAREPTNKIEVEISCNLKMEMISHQLCHVLLVRIQSTCKEKVLHKTGYNRNQSFLEGCLWKILTVLLRKNQSFITRFQVHESSFFLFFTSVYCCIQMTRRVPETL